MNGSPLDHDVVTEILEGAEGTGIPPGRLLLAAEAVRRRLLADPEPEVAERHVRLMLAASCDPTSPGSSGGVVSAPVRRRRTVATLVAATLAFGVVGLAPLGALPDSIERFVPRGLTWFDLDRAGSTPGEPERGAPTEGVDGASNGRREGQGPPDDGSALAPVGILVPAGFPVPGLDGPSPGAPSARTGEPTPEEMARPEPRGPAAPATPPGVVTDPPRGPGDGGAGSEGSAPGRSGEAPGTGGPGGDEEGGVPGPPVDPPRGPGDGAGPRSEGPAPGRPGEVPGVGSTGEPGGGARGTAPSAGPPSPDPGAGGPPGEDDPGEGRASPAGTGGAAARAPRPA